jgi:hypothetical protein
LKDSKMIQTRLANGISVLALVLSALPAGAAGPTTQHRIFFTAPAERKVFRIDVSVNETTRTASKPTVTQIFSFASGFTPADIAFGPDGNLYVVCAPDQICRIGQSGAGFVTFVSGGPTGIGGMRFLGDFLYFTATTGVFRKSITPGAMVEMVNVQSPVPPAGLTVSLTGDLVASDGANLFRVRRDENKDFTLVGSLSLGSFFSSTKGIAAEPVTQVSPSGQVTTANRKFVTGTRQAFPNRDAVAVFTCPSPSGTCTLQPFTFELAAGELARDIEINLTGSSFFATSTGTLYRFDPGKTPNPAILLADLKGKAKTGYGVALPPTSRTTPMASFPAGVETTINCGNSLVKVTSPTAATADFVCDMEIPGDLNGGFQGAAAGALCTQYDWTGGFCTQMTSTLPGAEFFVAYLKKDEPLAGHQPLIVHDSTDVTITNYYLAGELDPEDQTRGGRGFSTNVLADREVADPATFVDFKPQLSTDPDTPTVVNEELPVRPRFDRSPLEGETLRLSANCFDPLVFINPIRSVANSNDENFFRPAGDHWQFNLDLSNFPADKLCVLTIWGSGGAFVEAFIVRR